MNADAKSQVASVFLWQLSQVVGRPAWLTGVEAPVTSLWWHPKQVVGTVV